MSGKAVNRELDMVVTGFVVANSLKEVGKNILGQVLNTVQRRRPILNPKVAKSIVISKAWFGGFYRKRLDKVRRGTFPYLTPKGDSALSQSLDKRIRNTLDKSLIRKMISKSASRRPNPLIATFLMSKKLVNTDIIMNPV